MYSLKNICDRLKIEPEDFAHAIELIEDVKNADGEPLYDCSAVFDKGEKFYSPKILGWVLQLSKELKSDKVQDFVAKEVNESEVAEVMRSQKYVPFKDDGEPEVAEVQLMRRDIEAIASAGVQRLSEEQLKVAALEDKFRIYELLEKAVREGYDLDTADLENICGKVPYRRLDETFEYGSYGFTYLGKKRWKPWKADL